MRKKLYNETYKFNYLEESKIKEFVKGILSIRLTNYGKKLVIYFIAIVFIIAELVYKKANIDIEWILLLIGIVFIVESLKDGDFFKKK